jgi:hypothetical protein
VVAMIPALMLPRKHAQIRRTDDEDVPPVVVP